MKNDLETRVANRRRDLVAEIVDYKKNSSRAGSAPAIDKIQERLTELADIVRHGNVNDDWAGVSPNTRQKLEDWIAR